MVTHARVWNVELGDHGCKTVVIIINDHLDLESPEKSFNQGFAYIGLPCGCFCGRLSQLLIDVRVPSPLWAGFSKKAG